MSDINEGATTEVEKILEEALTLFRDNALGLLSVRAAAPAPVPVRPSRAPAMQPKG